MKVPRRKFLTAGTAFVVAACEGGPPRPAKRRLSIAAGLTGGVYYPYGGGIAKVVSETLPNVEVTAEATSGSIDNLKFIEAGKADIGFTLADTLDEAVKGQGAFRESGPLKTRTLAVLYDNSTHVVTLESAGIESLAQLRGRVVSVGAPGSGTEMIAVRILEAAGIDPASGIRRQGLGVNASVDAIKDGKLDAFFWSGGVPTGAILDLASTPGMKLRLLPCASLIDALQQKYGPLYSLTSIPKGTYAGVGSDVAVVAVANALVVSATMEDDLAHDLTRTLFQKQKELQAIHPEARHLTLARALTGSPAPFHPGAIRYYKETGAWKS